MSISLRRVGILTVAAAVAAAFLVAVGLPAGASVGHDRSYLVTVENLTETQLLTPTVVATHRGPSFYQPRKAASAVALEIGYARSASCRAARPSSSRPRFVKVCFQSAWSANPRATRSR